MAVLRWLTNPASDTERYLGFALASLLVLLAVITLNAIMPLEPFWSGLLAILPVAFLSNRYLGPIARRKREKGRK